MLGKTAPATQGAGPGGHGGDVGEAACNCLAANRFQRRRWQIEVPALDQLVDAEQHLRAVEIDQGHVVAGTEGDAAGLVGGGPVESGR